MHRVIMSMVLILLLVELSSAQTITVNNNLLFGNMFPGIPSKISKYTASSAAEFHVTGTNGAELSIKFTLPTYMSNTGFNIQLIFFNTDCSIDTSATPDQAAPTFDNLNPWTNLTYRLGSTGMLLWLGGTAVPRIVQPPGAYSATIVLTVSYTGN